VVRIDISYLIDRLENLVSNSRRLPLTSGVVVSKHECLQIIDQMRITIPQQIEEARQIKQERERVLALAREEAKRLLDQAQEQADQVLNERGLMKEAQERSASIVDEANRQAEETMRGADEYAINVLGRLEDQLIAVQTTIRNGLEILQQEGSRRQSSEAGLGDPAAAPEQREP
jgi:cell division septum initiation protein DivIVA